MLLLVGFGDGVRCSRSLLYGLPLSILQERVFLGKDGNGGIVQSIIMSEGGKWYGPRVDSVDSVIGDS